MEKRKISVGRVINVALVLFMFVNVSNASMVAHWTFDEGSGWVAGDSVGGHNGTVSNAQWAQGKIGGCLNFNGTNSQVSIGSGIMDFNGNNPFTVALWIKGPGNNRENAIIGTGVTNGWYCRIGSQGSDLVNADSTSFFFKIDDGVDDAYPVGVTTINIADDQWHHVAASIDGSELKGYVDGILQFSVPYSNVNDLYDGFTVGHFVVGDYYKGLIDDVRLYDNALLQSEITALVPEPATLLLFGLGFGLMRKKRK